MGLCSGFREQYYELPFAGCNNVTTIKTCLCFYVRKILFYQLLVRATTIEDGLKAMSHLNTFLISKPVTN